MIRQEFDTNLYFIAVSAQHTKAPLQDSLPQSGGEARLQPENAVMLKHGTLGREECESQPRPPSKFKVIIFVLARVAGYVQLRSERFYCLQNSH